MTQWRIECLWCSVDARNHCPHLVRDAGRDEVTSEGMVIAKPTQEPLAWMVPCWLVVSGCECYLAGCSVGDGFPASRAIPGQLTFRGYKGYPWVWPSLRITAWLSPDTVPPTCSSW